MTNCSRCAAGRYADGARYCSTCGTFVGGGVEVTVAASSGEHPSHVWTINRWYKNAGDPVERQELICEVVSSRGISEFASVHTGTIFPLVPAGGNCRASDVIARIETPNKEKHWVTTQAGS